MPESSATSAPTIEAEPATEPEIAAAQEPDLARGIHPRPRAQPDQHVGGDEPGGAHLDGPGRGLAEGAFPEVTVVSCVGKGTSVG